MLGWLVFEIGKEKVATTLGAVSGAVAGMVAITPCAGFIGPMPALAVGAVGGIICALAVRVKFRLRYDDSLDVLAVHGMGGVVGMVLLGLFASRAIDPAGANGLFEGGGLHFFSEELLAVVVSVAFCFGMSYLIAKVIDMTMGLRVAPDVEFEGLDLRQHAETAYSSGSTAGHHGA